MDKLYLVDEHGFVWQGDIRPAVARIVVQESRGDDERYKAFVEAVNSTARLHADNARLKDALQAAGVELDKWAAYAFTNHGNDAKLYNGLKDLASTALLPASGRGEAFNLTAHLHRQRAWSERTFGPGTRTLGVIAHIRKEIAEIEANPNDLFEWVDVVLLALDGAWRSGHEPEAIAEAINAKQTKNENRQWPDWRMVPHDGPIEHVKGAGDGQ